MIRTFKNYSLSDFQIPNTLLLTSHQIVHYIPVAYLFYNWKFVLFDPFHLFCPPPNPCILQTPIRSLCELGFYFIFLVLHVSEIIWYLSFSDLFCLTQCPQGMIHVVANGKISFFLWLNNITLYI